MTRIGFLSRGSYEAKGSEHHYFPHNRFWDTHSNNRYFRKYRIESATKYTTRLACVLSPDTWWHRFVCMAISSTREIGSFVCNSGAQESPATSYKSKSFLD